MGEGTMGQCRCGYTRDVEKNCDGTHKVVKAVKEDIANKIDSLSLGEENAQLNALGMRMLAAQAAREADIK